MKQFCHIACSKKGYFITAFLGIFFSVFYIEMMLCKCLQMNNMEASVLFRRSFLYLFFIILFLAVLGYYVGEWIEECKQELQVLLYCGFTKKELKLSFRKLLALLELISWWMGSIIFYIVFQGTLKLFFYTIFGTLVLEYIFCMLFCMLFFRGYKIK